MKIILIGGVPESLVRFRGPLIERFVSLGHDVLAMAGSAHEPTTRELERLGARFATFPLGRSRTGPFEDLATCYRLAAVFRAERPDLVLAYTAKPVVWGGIAARLAGVPAFHALVTGLGGQFAGEGGGARRWLGGLLERLYRLALARARTVTFQNEEDRQTFVSCGIVERGQTRRVHGSGVDLSQYPPSPLPGGAPVFLMVARFLAAKGVREYAAAARLTAREFPDARFLLVGVAESGPLAVPLAEIEAWHEEGVLEHLGYLDDVGEAMAGCHVFVLPSYYGEGLPRTILEAMATGRPVLTCDNVGCRDAVEHDGNGLVVPPRDGRALARGMQELLARRDEWPAMADRGLALARERYDVHRVNDELVEILGLAGRASPS